MPSRRRQKSSPKCAMTSFMPLCPPAPPPRLRRATPGRQVELVMHDQHLVRRELEVVAERAHRLAAAIHVAHRLQEPQRLARDLAAARLGVVAPLRPQAQLMAARQFVDEPEARVVARVFVFGARIAEPDDQMQRKSGQSALLLAVALLGALVVLRALGSAALRIGAGGAAARVPHPGSTGAALRQALPAAPAAARRTRGGCGGSFVDDRCFLLLDARHVDRRDRRVAPGQQFHDRDARPAA